MRGIKTSEHLHYLKILQKNHYIFQPEIRLAIDYAVNLIEKNTKEKEAVKE